MEICSTYMFSQISFFHIQSKKKTMATEMILPLNDPFDIDIFPNKNMLPHEIFTDA